MNKDHLHTYKLLGITATLVIVLSFPGYLLKERYVRARAVQVLEPTAEFVGRDKCIDCHREAYERWLGSDHDRAMDIATEQTVLADFNNTTFTHNGITSRFYRKGDRYYVNTEGPNGDLADFEITHVFGYDPLQQYLVPFPGGRLQCLTIAWDIQKEQWYHLYPENTPPPGDWLHWTRNGQNWNGMCAECHSTDLRKNYDPETDTYNTTWSEIDVSCEACHGPGSLHVKWAKIDPMARPESKNYDLAVMTSDLDSDQMVELCSPCHSRRTILGDYDHTGTEQLDIFIPELLTEGNYHADGQILEEVYVYGSFVQSKMYRMGVRCADCHDSHSTKLLKEGNDLCLQCHRADTYNTADHHFHKEVHEGKLGPGWSCVACHMPGQDYMGIDNRADHSIRIPRPDQNLAIGLPDACSKAGCHGDKPVKWSAEAYTKWYGISRRPHFGTVLASAREGKTGALEDLVRLAEDRLYPAIVRATAIQLMREYRDDRILEALERALTDEEPLVRRTAAANSDFFPEVTRAELLGSLLWDPVRAVRIQAASSLAEVPADLLKPDQRKKLPKVVAEYEVAMSYSLDFSFAGFNLGNLYVALEKPEEAENFYRTAIQVDDLFYPARINMAMLLNSQGRNDEAEKLFLEVLEAYPDLHETAYSLGLLYVEMKRPAQGAVYLSRAAVGMPDRPRIRYNLGLLLQQMGRLTGAEASLRQAVDREPDNLDFNFALADHYLKRGMLLEARVVVVRMLKMDPDNRAAREMMGFIDSRLGNQ
jgi:predicted CXXCH cytochrome family protein